MPNADRTQTVYLDTGNPDSFNASALYNPGQLGIAFDAGSNAYQIVQMDSGATASAASGIPAINQLAYWKDRSVYLVTTDSRFGLFAGQANSFRNNVAGVLRNAVTPGNYCAILQRGRNINVKEAGSATGGMSLCSDTSTTAAQALGTAIATSSPTQQIGVVVTATAASVCVADIDIPNIP